MRQQARVLPPEEWDRLEKAQIPDLWRYTRPEDCEAIVVEDDGAIVASMLVLRITHLEGLWIAPERRGDVGVTRKLLRATVEAASRWAWYWAIAGAADDRMRGILGRVGGRKLEMDSYMIPLGRETCRSLPH